MQEYSFKGLKAYEAAYNMAKEVYKLSRELPEYEQYGLGSQIRRAATGIPLNIAEGYGRREYENDYKRFLSIAKGSCNEVLVLIDMLKDFGYIREERHKELSREYDKIGGLLYGLISKANERSGNKPNTES